MRPSNHDREKTYARTTARERGRSGGAGTAQLARWFERVADDVRFALRGFRKTPGFTFSVVLLLGLGIGANAALFSVMYGLLISPLPFPDGNRMVRVLATGNGGEFYLDVPKQLVTDWSSATRAASEVTLLRPGRWVLGDTAAPAPRQLDGISIVPGALAFVGAAPVLGRDIASADTTASAASTTLISYALWQSEFGGREDIVGQTILLNGEHHAVVGVAPPDFWLPFMENRRDVFPALRDATSGFEAMAKLRPGFGAADGDREIAALWRGHDHSTGMQRDVPTLKRQADLVPDGVRRMVYVLVAGVAVVLLIATANVANLLMARAWNRRRELALRAAIGAGRRRLFQQVFLESFVLALLGGVVGVLVAQLSLALIDLLQAQGGRAFFVTDRAGIQGVVVWSTLGFSVIAAFLFGIGPAFVASATDLLENLKAGGRALTTSVVTRRLRMMLVVGEVALSVVLLAGAGLLVRSLGAMQTADTGMNPTGLYSFSIRLPETAFPTPQARRDAIINVLNTVRAAPGVQHASFGVMMPPDFGVAVSGFELSDRELHLPDSLRSVSFNRVAPDAFDVAGISLLHGRTFTPSTALSDSTGPAEIIVSESFARRFWPSGNALGHRIKLGRSPWAEVVGIVNDVRVPGLGDAWHPLQLYQPASAARARASIIVRSPLPNHDVVAAVSAAVQSASPVVEIGGTGTADAYFGRWRAPQQFLLKLIGIFGALALLLAAVGLHAVVAYAVGQRTREFGVRLALGAEPASVMAMVHRQGLALAGGGVLIGIVVSLAATRFLRSLLYGVSPGDPVTLAGVATVLLLTALVATHLPARRAMRADPLVVLREE